MPLPDFKPKNCCSCKRVSVSQRVYDTLKAKAELFDEVVDMLDEYVSGDLIGAFPVNSDRAKAILLLSKAKEL